MPTDARAARYSISYPRFPSASGRSGALVKPVDRPVDPQPPGQPLRVERRPHLHVVVEVGEDVPIGSPDRPGRPGEPGTRRVLPRLPGAHSPGPAVEGV